jgi:hypothetical protein
MEGEHAEEAEAEAAAEEDEAEAVDVQARLVPPQSTEV